MTPRACRQSARPIGSLVLKSDPPTFRLGSKPSAPSCPVIDRVQILMSFYNRDDSLPYWRNNVSAEFIFENFAHRTEKAQAWLRYRNVSQTCSGFLQATMM